MDTGTTSMAPITKIPNEILAEIFLYTFPGSNEIPNKQISSRIQLTQVCREWRAVALGEVLLWNDVMVHIPYDRLGTENPKILQRANMCLALSKDSPITIRIIHSYSADPDASGHAISGFVLSYAKRIIHLEVHTKIPNLLQSLLRLPAGSFPSLRRLVVMVIPRPVDAPSLPKEVHAFRNTPNLRSVDVRLPRSLTDMGIPSSQLRELSLRGVGKTPVQFIINDLKSCIHLHSLALDPPDEETGLPTTIYAEMLYLKKLELCGGMLHNERRISVPLTAPNLEELAVHSACWSGEILSSFVVRSQCKIRRLRLIRPLNTFPDDFLGYIPYVEELDMGSIVLASSAMKEMSLGTAFPVLRSLKCATRSGTLHELLNMLISRARQQDSNPPSRIEDVEIVLASFHISKSLAMEWLQKQGIRIRTRSTSTLNNKKNLFNDELDFVPPL